jgi:hypothetical protein
LNHKDTKSNPRSSSTSATSASGSIRNYERAANEKLIHDQSLVTVLRQIHDELDAVVLEAYGWGNLSTRDTGIPACSSAPGAPPEEAGRNAYITELPSWSRKQ